MPRVRYLKYNPRAETRLLINQIDELLREYAEAGYNLTVRQAYYQFIARDLLPESWIDQDYNLRKGLALDTKNTEKNYKNLQSIIAKARDSGMLDWRSIVDRGREPSQRPHWEGPRDFLLSVAPQFGVDLWSDQPTRCEVWVEKEALIDVVERAASRYDVLTFACKGYVSASSIWEAGHDRILRKYHANGQRTVIIHLGDHDPSGVDMSRDILRRLQLYSRPYHDASEDEGDEYPEYRPSLERPEVSLRRIALNMDQVRQYNPPPNPAKETDSRAPRYVERFGHTSWELDALDPPVLVELIRQEIISHMNPDLYDARQQLEDDWKARLEELAAEFEE